MVTRQVYTNTIAQIAGKLSTVLLSIILIKVLTNYLSVEDYGLYNKIYNYLSIFSVIADLGLYTITVREIAACVSDRARASMIVGNVLTIRTTLGVAIIFLALAIGWYLPGYNSSLALVSIFIVGLFTLFGLVNSSILSVLQAYLRTEFSFVSTTVGKVVNVAGIVLVAIVLYPTAELVLHPELHFSAFTLIIVMGLLGNVVMTLMLWWYAQRIEKVWFRWDREYARKLFKMTLPYGIALFLNVVYFKVDMILLSIMEPRNVADISVGLYSVPMKIVEVGMMFGTLFLNSLLPLFTQSIQKHDQKNLWHLVDRAFRVLFVAGVGIVGLFMAGGREIILLVASRDYVEKGLYIYTSLDSLRIVVWIFLFYFLSSLFTYILIAHEEQGRLLRINTILTITNIVGNIILIPYLSFIGSSIVTTVSQVLLLGMTWHASRHITDWRPSFRFVAVVTGSCLVAGVAAWQTLVSVEHAGVHPVLALILGGTVFGGIYIAGAYSGHRLSQK